MEIMTSVILDYCLTANADFAIMLNGKWGLGKTYFINNVLIPKLSNTKSTNNVNFKPIYVSLNGISDLNDVFAQIASSKIEFSDTKIGKASLGFLNSVANVFNIDLKKNFSVKDFLDFNDHVLIFDDLERISSSINLEDVLGFLNTNFIERNKVKTIIVANEDFITSDEESNIERRDKYYLIKEKFIGRTIEFTSDLRSALLEFINNVTNPKVKSIILEYADFIWNIVENSKIENLRVLKFIVSNVNRILDSLDLDKEKSDCTSLIFFITTFSIEFKLQKDLKTLFTEEMTNFFVGLRKIEIHSLNNHSYSVGKYPGEFSNKYLKNGNDKFFFYSSVFKFITSGALIKDDLLQEFSKVELLKEQERKPNPSTEYGRLAKYTSLRRKEFRNLCAKVLWNIKKGNFDPYEFPRVLSTMLELSNNGILYCKTETINSWFDKGFKKSITVFSYSELNFSDFIRSEIEFIDTKVKWLATQLRTWHNEKKEEDLNVSIVEFQEKLLKANNRTELRDALRIAGRFHIIKDIKIQVLVYILTSLKNPILFWFTNYLIDIYDSNRSNLAKYDKIEDENRLKELIIQLRKRISQTSKKEIESLTIQEFIQRQNYD